MKIRELMDAVELNELLNLAKQPTQQQRRRPIIVQPDAVKRKQTVGTLVNQIAAADTKRAPKEEDMVLAMWKYRDVQQQANDNLRRTRGKQERE